MKGGSLGPVLLAGLGPVIFLFLIFLALFSGAGGWILWRPPVLWTDQFGPTRPYVHNTIIDITLESNSFETTGYLNGTTGGPGFNYSTEFGTPFIRDYSPNGGVLWTSMITDIPGFLPFSISAGPDRTYLAGSASQNTTLLKYDLNGTRLWSKDTLPLIEGKIAATADNVYYAGIFGNLDLVQKYDANGYRLWTSNFSNASYGRVVGMQADSSELFILTETSLLKYSLDGSRLWSHPFGTAGLSVGPEAFSEDNSGVYVSGIVSAGRLGPYNGFVSKYDFDGNMIWTEGFSSPDEAGVISTSLWADPSGVYVSYGSPSSAKGFVAKYDSNHNQAWSFETPVAPEGAFHIAYTAGELFLAGTVSRNAFVQAFSGSASLIFFGLNPPLSFVFLGSLLTVIGVSAYFLARRYYRRVPRRPRSASPERNRNNYRDPNPRA